MIEAIEAIETIETIEAIEAIETIEAIEAIEVIGILGDGGMTKMARSFFKIGINNQIFLLNLHPTNKRTCRGMDDYTN